MKQMGKVIAVHEGSASVRFARSEMCGDCHACFRMGENETEIELENTLGASVGDTVYIQLHESSVLKASLIMYGVPLLALLLGVLCCAPLGDLYAALGGLLLSGAAFFLLHALEPRFAKMRQFKPRMIAIAANAEPSDANADSKPDSEEERG